MGEGVAANWDAVRTLVSNAVTDGTTSLPDADPRWRKARADAARESTIDEQLRAAGLHPGDPRLHPAPARDGSGGAP
jgi:hypothetical protein